MTSDYFTSKLEKELQTFKKLYVLSKSDHIENAIIFPKNTILTRDTKIFITHNSANLKQLKHIISNPNHMFFKIEIKGKNNKDVQFCKTLSNLLDKQNKISYIIKCQYHSKNNKDKSAYIYYINRQNGDIIDKGYSIIINDQIHTSLNDEDDDDSDDDNKQNREQTKKKRSENYQWRKLREKIVDDDDILK